MTVVRSLLGPASFGIAAVVGGRLEQGYRDRDEPISALAAHGTRSACVMVPGFLGLAAGSLLLARDLRGAAAAPRPVPAMVALSGLTTAAAGLARNSDRTCPTRFLGDTGVQRTDDLHAAFSMATFALWIATPLVAARRATGAGPAYRRRSRGLGLGALAATLAMGRVARGENTAWAGALQRLMIATALAWYPLAASESQRR